MLERSFGTKSTVLKVIFDGRRYVPSYVHIVPLESFVWISVGSVRLVLSKQFRFQNNVIEP